MVAFAADFGPVDASMYVKSRDPDNAAVTLVTNKPVGGKPFDGYKARQSRHSDRSYNLDPA